jgi:Tol biopolymer transport system component
MNSVKQLLRAAALAGAALLLPCCRDQIGQGDELLSVIVRASLNLSKIEPNLLCDEPAVSGNGRFVVFCSTSNNIAPNDNNGLRDIFLRDRSTGVIVNLTNVLLFGEFPQYAPADCFEPCVSDDGNFVAFVSRGGWVPYTLPASTNPFKYVYRYNRSQDLFEKAYVSVTQPNADMSHPSISADGQIIAFTTSATNLTPANAGGVPQIYVHNFNTGVDTIVSRAQSPAALNVPCNGSCDHARISPDGGFVVFDSTSTNLNAATAALAMPQVYLGTSGGGYVTVVARDSVGTLTNNTSYLPDVSAGGQFVVFHTYDTSLVTPPVAGGGPILVRRDLVNGITELVTDKPGGIPFLVFPNGFPPSISGDGRMIAFLSRDDSLAGGASLNFKAQVFVRDMQAGITFCSRHLDGTPSNIDCSPPRLSADGSTVVWSTQGSTLVDGDSNGVSDIFLRSPLR